MNPFLRSILSVIIGVVVGSLVNMSLIMVSGYVIPPPDGADVTTTEGLKASLHLFEPKHFIFPFLAHAVGTFFGAVVAFLIANAQSVRAAYIVSGFFLVGGITNVLMLPSPLWFTVLDLLMAYIPMGYLAILILRKKS